MLACHCPDDAEHMRRPHQYIHLHTKLGLLTTWPEWTKLVVSLGSSIHLFLHFWWNLASDCCRGVCNDIQKEECCQRTQVKASNGWNDSTENVEVRVGNGVQRLEGSNACCLRNPSQQNTSRNDKVKGSEEVSKTTDKDLFGNSVTRDCHRGALFRQGASHSSAVAEVPVAATSSNKSSGVHVMRREKDRCSCRSNEAKGKEGQHGRLHLDRLQLDVIVV
jgi:hypothetical protein